MEWHIFDAPIVNVSEMVGDQVPWPQLLRWHLECFSQVSVESTPSCDVWDDNNHTTYQKQVVIDPPTRDMRASRTLAIGAGESQAEERLKPLQNLLNTFLGIRET